MYVIESDFIVEKDILLSSEIEKRNIMEKQLSSVKKDNEQLAINNKVTRLSHGLK